MLRFKFYVTGRRLTATQELRRAGNCGESSEMARIGQTPKWAACAVTSLGLHVALYSTATMADRTTKKLRPKRTFFSYALTIMWEWRQVDTEVSVCEIVFFCIQLCTTTVCIRYWVTGYKNILATVILVRNIKSNTPHRHIALLADPNSALTSPTPQKQMPGGSLSISIHIPELSSCNFRCCYFAIFRWFCKPETLTWHFGIVGKHDSYFGEQQVVTEQGCQRCKQIGANLFFIIRPPWAMRRNALPSHLVVAIFQFRPWMIRTMAPRSKKSGK